MNATIFPKTNRRGVWFGVLMCAASLAVLADLPANQAKLDVANTGFAFDLLKQITREQPGTNVFISPFSVSTVLQMVANGAAGDTKAEMQRVLKTAGLPAETLNAACKNLNQSLNSQTNVILNLANAIWYKEGFHLKPGFVSDNKNYFSAKLAGVEFGKPESAQTINDWADHSTHGKIKEVVRWPFPPLTRVILANAIYFKGKWERPFDKQATKDHAFNVLPGGTPKQVPMMWQHGRFNYQQVDGFQAVRLPYAGGRLQMVLFLPDTNSSPAKLLADLNADTWRDKILPGFRDREGTLAFPRFKLDYDVKLNDPLKALGMRQAFSNGADFSAMADEQLFVSEVKQKSFVEVNEEGTEAAAVTALIMRSQAIIEPVRPFEMIVDRPFFFVIGDDQTRSILFMGLVYDPAGQGGGGLKSATSTRPSDSLAPARSARSGPSPPANSFRCFPSNSSPPSATAERENFRQSVGESGISGNSANRAQTVPSCAKRDQNKGEIHIGIFQLVLNGHSVIQVAVGNKFRLGVLGSGKGSNFAAIAIACAAGKIPAEVTVVLSDVENAGILAHARDRKIPAQFVPPGKFRTKLDEEAERAFVGALQAAKVDLIVLAGFMRVLKGEFLRAFEGRIVNIHPSLLPSFPGLEAWKQALDHGMKLTGCTVHFVDAGVDAGPIIGQQAVPVLDHDTPEMLHHRIQAAEHELYPKCIAAIARGEISVVGRRVIRKKQINHG